VRARTAALALASALLIATPASAHVGVKSYSPKRGSTVSRSLERVKVTFKARITDGKLTVRGPNGAKVSRGDGVVVDRDRVLRVRLKGGKRPGRYTVSMSVLNTDGHVTHKSWSFNLR
jgi:copper resistance protein C